MKAIITIGISASGKTTWATEFVENNRGWMIISRDDIRAELMGGKLIWAKWNWRYEDEVTKVQRRRFLEARNNGFNIIVADTNLTRIEALESYLRNLGFEIERKEFPISLEEAIERDSKRELSVSEKVIRMQYEKWLLYLESK